MKIAFVASEAVPHAKTGGLADVAGTLPDFLRRQGNDVIVFMPRYKGIKANLKTRLQIKMDKKKYDVGIYEDSDFIFIDYPDFFERDGLYGDKGDFPDNCERFTLFDKAVVQLIQKDSFDIIHCHDWQTGLIPLYLRDMDIPVKCIFTIHNLGYQGVFSAAKFPLLGINKDYFKPEGIEFYGNINFLKAGILYSDIVSTVSKNYAQEIQTPELGFKLDGVLRTRQEALVGIINGIDYDQWNPELDEFIYEKYNDFQGKQENRQKLLVECDLKPGRPLIGMVSRIAEQKGFDLIVKAFDSIMDLGFSVIILGFGDESYHRKLTQLSTVYAQRFSLNIKFDNRLAHGIYAGSDFFLMPSRYEPCGLGQLISLKYGTVPVVRYTGGLADTISDFDPMNNKGNGFVFTEYSTDHLLTALSRAFMVYSRAEVFRELSENCMVYDFSWDESARQYVQLYQRVLSY